MKPVRVSTIEEIKDRLMDPDAVVEKAIEESSGYKWAPYIYPYITLANTVNEPLKNLENNLQGLIFISIFA